MSLAHCPQCREQVPVKGAQYYPFCSAPLTTPTRERTPQGDRQAIQRTSYPPASGVLSILASSYAVLWAILISIMLALGYQWGTTVVPSVVLSFVGFAFGLAGGIMTLRRRAFLLAVGGTSCILVVGLVVLWISILWGLTTLGILWGLPTLVLSILSFIFLAMSSKEFS